MGILRFLAKVGLGYAVRRHGLAGFNDVFLRPIVLGDVRGAMTYVGCDSRAPLGAILPGQGPHALTERQSGTLLSVRIQSVSRVGDRRTTNDLRAFRTLKQDLSIRPSTTSSRTA